MITMGRSAITFFRERGIDTRFHIVAGGIDVDRFRPSKEPPTTDLILIGRLASVKRVDLFLGVVKCVQAVLPGTTATVVGDGPLRASLEQLAHQLGVDCYVTFVGHQQDVELWLRKAKVFVLTSDSERLALSLVEAMLAGVPGVVSRVGDLGDLVDDGVNGFLVSERTPEAFASRLVDLLSHAEKRTRFGAAARRSAERHELSATVRLWDDILASPERTRSKAVAAHWRR